MLPVNKPSDALKYGDGIVQSTERIDHYIKAKILKLASDVIGEAASQHCYFVAERDAYPAFFVRYWCLELNHAAKLSKIHQILYL